MAKSILKNDPVCFVCGNPYSVQKHHIYGGGNRSVSEDNGCWVYLCSRDHQRNIYSVHGDPDHRLDKELKAMCQSIYERDHTREDFIKLVGKSYK